jgi:formylglycine-generating enzyme required for sulfatase activity
LAAAPVDPGKTWKEPVTGMEFVWVPAGCFDMGSGDADADERPVHQVCVQGFWLGKYEVTQGQWQRVAGHNPAWFKRGSDYPVESVSWPEVQAFIAKLNRKGQGGLRLPSEAEWEYACRSGGRTETYCGGEDLDPYAWYSGNSMASTHPVGRKQANGLGLHDMSGNLWEWVQDCYRLSYQGAPSDGSAWEASECFSRVLRGGAWLYDPNYARAAYRHRTMQDGTNTDIGFRLARTP